VKGVIFLGVTLDNLIRITEQLHRRLPSRIVIALEGTLGSGKTRFAQSIAAAAGVNVAEVTSPTFTLIQHYRGQRLIHHIDAYRLADEDEFIEIGGEELMEDEAMILIEWPGRIGACLPQGCLRVELESDRPEDATRTIRMTSEDEPLVDIVCQVADGLQHDGISSRRIPS